MNFYDEFYKTGSSTGEADFVVKQLAKYLPTGTKILDLGAGDGRHTKYLTDKGYTVTATDNSKEALKKLRQLAEKEPAITTVQADFNDTNTLPQEVFDAIVCTYVLQDLAPEQAKKLAEYAAEHVTKAGYIAAAVFLGKFTGIANTVKSTFKKWHWTETKRGKVQSVYGELDGLELLLQKPFK
jgi:cyclopropane fatty-acyl-phospholipid synthase-like methyltransferase